MTFVDDLNESLDNELDTKEKAEINTIVKNVLLAIRVSCTNHRYEHSLKGYYSYFPGGYIDDPTPFIRPELKDASTFPGMITISAGKTVEKPLNVEKLKNEIEQGISELGFKNFVLKLIPCTRVEKIENGKGFFGNIKYSEIVKTDYNIYVKLEW